MSTQELQQETTEVHPKLNMSNLQALQHKPRRIKRQNRIKIDLAKTYNQRVRMAGLDTLMYCSFYQESKEEINLYWFDTYVHDEFVRKLKPYQRVNHFPGSQALGKKNLLSNCINRMKKMTEKQYDFFPNTFIFPADIQDFQRFSSEQQNKFYIVKPCSDCQGRGIFLTKHPDSNAKEQVVVQQYIQNPLLLEKTKFDLRLYVLIRSITPLRIYLYEEGLSRLATCDYQKPLSSNQKNMRMHLTNYAINKLSPNFIFNKSETQDDIGHKRSYRSTMRALKDLGCDIVWLQGQIDKIIVKTLISAHPTISKRYKDIRDTKQQLQSVCFEVLGFDILINQQFQPFLLEVNHSPSFCAETPLDLVIKKHLLLDTLNLLNLNHDDKINYLKSRNQQDNIHSNQIMKTYVKNQLKDTEPEESGAFRKIYPLENVPQNQSVNKLYQRLLKLSKVQKYTPSKALGPIARGFPFSNQKIDKIRETTDSISQHDTKTLSFYNVLHNVKRTKLKQLKQAIQLQQLIPSPGQSCLRQQTNSNNQSIEANPERQLQRLQKQEVLIYESTIRRDKQRERKKYICPVPVNNVNIRLDERFSHRVKDHKASPAEVQTSQNRFKIHSMFSTTVERKRNRDQSNKTASNWFREGNSNEEKFRATDRFLGKYSYSIELKQKIQRMQMARLRIQKIRKIDKASFILVKSSSPQK